MTAATLATPSSPPPSAAARMASTLLPTATESLPAPIEGSDAAALESDLLRRAQHGDHAAFGEIVTLHRARIHAHIFHMVRNPDDAWDLAQDSFLKAWKSLPGFRGQSSFHTWLHRIATNVTIDWIRRRKQEKTSEFDDSIGLHSIEPDAPTAPRHLPGPRKSLEHRELKAQIEDALAQLSPEHRAVILLKEIEQRQYHEIAELLDIQIGTVMSRLFYARKKLQALLKSAYHENL